MTLAAGSLVTMAPVRDEAGTQSQPPPKPVEQIQIGDKVKWPGHELNYVVTDKKTNADGSITLMLGLDPEDDPNDDAYDLTQQGYRIHEAYLDVQHTGATHVKQGLEVYKAVAEFYATGPFYELGGAALVAASGKASELLRLATAQKGLAQKAGEVAAKVRAYAAKVRQAVTNAKQEGKSAEEIAQLTKQAENAEKEAGQLEAGAKNAQSLAKHSEDAGVTTQEITKVQNPEAVWANTEPQLLALPAGGTPNVTANTMGDSAETAYELALANDISRLRGAHIEGPPTGNYPGIDGWINGEPLSFKMAQTAEPSNVKKQVVKAMAKAGNHGYRDVEVRQGTPNSK